MRDSKSPQEASAELPRGPWSRRERRGLGRVEAPPGRLRRGRGGLLQRPHRRRDLLLGADAATGESRCVVASPPLSARCRPTMPSLTGAALRPAPAPEELSLQCLQSGSADSHNSRRETVLLRYMFGCLGVLSECVVATSSRHRRRNHLRRGEDTGTLRDSQSRGVREQPDLEDFDHRKRKPAATDKSPGPSAAVGAWAPGGSLGRGLVSEVPTCCPARAPTRTFRSCAWRWTFF